MTYFIIGKTRFDWLLLKPPRVDHLTTKLLNSLQSEKKPEGSFGGSTEGCGSHLLHQFPGGRGGQTTENHTGRACYHIIHTVNSFSSIATP